MELRTLQSFIEEFAEIQDQEKTAVSLDWVRKHTERGAAQASTPRLKNFVAKQNEGIDRGLTAMPSDMHGASRRYIAHDVGAKHLARRVRDSAIDKVHGSGGNIPWSGGKAARGSLKSKAILGAGSLAVGGLGMGTAHYIKKHTEKAKEKQASEFDLSEDYLETRAAFILKVADAATVAGKILKRPAAAVAGGATRVLGGGAGHLPGAGVLKPTAFTPPPGGMPTRNTMMPGANVLKPTSFTPPTRESVFNASRQAAPIGAAAQSAPAAGFHHDPFGGGEFKVRSPRPTALGTPVPTGKFASLRKFAGVGQFMAQNATHLTHGAELAGLGILAKPSIDEMRGKEVDPKKKARTELAGLGVLAAPSALSMGGSMVNRFRKAAPAALGHL